MCTPSSSCGPALRSEELLRRFFRLAEEGKVNAKGKPGLLELALIARDFEPEGYATKPPLAVQRALLGPLAVIARNRTAAASPAPYLFVDEWDVAAPREAVFDALADARTYPEWWRPVYLAVEADGPPEVGQRLAPALQGAPARTRCTRRSKLDRARAAEPDRGRRRRRPVGPRNLDVDRRKAAAPTFASTGEVTPTGPYCAT